MEAFDHFSFECRKKWCFICCSICQNIPKNHHSRVWCSLHAQLLMLLEACMCKSFSSIVNVCFGIVSLAFFGASACTWGSWSYFLCSVDTVLYRRIPCDLVFCCWHIINSLLEVKRCVASTADTLAVSHNVEKNIPHDNMGNSESVSRFCFHNDVSANIISDAYNINSIHLIWASTSWENTHLYLNSRATASFSLDIKIYLLLCWHILHVKNLLTVLLSRCTQDTCSC